MKRDFSDSAREELLELVRQVEKERKWEFLDQIGDIWKEFKVHIGWLRIDKYLDDLSNYHKQMIDKDDKTEEDIENIFIKVKELDQIYAVRFAAYKTMLEQLIALVDQFSDTISPEKLRLKPKDLEPFINKYNNSAKYLRIIGGEDEGLSEKDIENLKSEGDDSTISIIVNGIGESIIGMLPDITIGDEVEIPIGSDMSIYYSTSTTIEGNVDIDLNASVKEQKLKLENVSCSFSGDGILSFEGNTDGEIGISIASQDRNIFSSENKNVEQKIVKQNGNDTYEVKLIGSLEEVKYEKSIKTEYEQGSVTSAIGIKKKSNNSWKPFPIQAMPQEETCILPRFERPSINWPMINWWQSIEDMIIEGIGEAIVEAGIAATIIITIIKDIGWGVVVFV